jgi:hypothetical protein
MRIPPPEMPRGITPAVVINLVSTEGWNNSSIYPTDCPAKICMFFGTAID